MAKVPLHALGKLEAEAHTDGQYRLAGMDGVRAYNLAAATRTAFTSTSTAAVAIGTLADAREVLLTASARCFVALGASDVGAAARTDAAVIPIEEGEKFPLRLAAGVTHYRVIRDTADGVLRTIPVA